MCHWSKEKAFHFQFAEPPAYRAPPKPRQVVPQSGHREQELLKRREKPMGLNSCLLTSLAHGPSALTDLYRYMSFFFVAETCTPWHKPGKQVVHGRDEELLPRCLLEK